MKWPRHEKDPHNVCPICGTDCKTKKKYRKHIREVHGA